MGVALKKNERKYLIYFSPSRTSSSWPARPSPFLRVMPLAVKFLLSFAKENVDTALITLDAYLSFLNNMILAFGLVFQLPLVVLLLSLLGILTPAMMKKTRKFEIVGIFVFAQSSRRRPTRSSVMMLAAPSWSSTRSACSSARGLRENGLVEEEPEEKAATGRITF